MTSFSDLSSKEHFINNCVHLRISDQPVLRNVFSNLVKVEDQIQLTDIMEIFVQYLDKVVDGLINETIELKL